MVSMDHLGVVRVTGSRDCTQYDECDEGGGSEQGAT